MTTLHTASTTARPQPVRRISTWVRVRRAWQLYVLLALPMLWIAVFSYVPMFGLSMAFKDFSPAAGIMDSPWVGLKHFERFVTGPHFVLVLKNTLVLSLYSLLVAFPVPIVLALCLNAIRQKFFARSVQMIAYAPNFISTVVLVSMMYLLLAPDTGLVNTLAGMVGLPQVNFMADPGWFRHLYVFSGVWQTAGFSAIIYLAALSGVPQELHEAAIVDGASRLRRMWHIDLPGIAPIAVIMLILSLGSTVSIGFEKALLMQTPLNLDVSQIIDTYVYQVGIKSPLPQFSYATAIGLFQSVVGMVLLLLVNTAARRISDTSLI